MADVGEDEPDSRPVAAAGSRGPVRRLARFGITLALVASLLYVAMDAVPPAWIGRLAAVSGLGDGDSGSLDSRAELPVSSGDIPALDATRGDVDEDVAPGDGSGREEAGQGVALEESPATGPGAPALSAPTFVVNFSSGSDLLESDAWHTLDTAALLLREEPDRIAVITDSGRGPEAQAPDPGLPGARIAAVEQYLMAAGIDRQRLRVRGQASLASEQGPGAPGAGPDGTDDRLVHISIGSR